VRTVLPATTDGQPHLAARILDYMPASDEGAKRIR